MVESDAVAPICAAVTSVRLRAVWSVVAAPTRLVVASVTDNVVESGLVPLSINPLITIALTSETLMVVESAVLPLESIADVSVIERVVDSTIAPATAVATDSVREIVVDSVRVCAAKSPVSASEMVSVVTSFVAMVTDVGVTTESIIDSVGDSLAVVPT
jgi:hypothetical protein